MNLIRWALMLFLLPPLVHAGTCMQTAAPACIEGPSTKVIGGEPVTRACWAWEAAYECIKETVDECAPLLAAGCTQSNAKCIQYLANGSCALQQNTMQCMTSPGVQSSILNCGANAYCLDGNCYGAGAPPNGDFALAATMINILGEAGKDYDPNTLQIFKGAGKTCQRTGGVVAGIVNCCSDSGWAVGLGLETCSAEEKSLGLAREEKLTHFIEEVCTSSTLFGMCVKYTQAHCQFTSKLSRIVQEQGRPQLAMGWGSAVAPQCQGFTATQMQSLDFSLMDLSEFYTDAMKNAKLLDPTQMGTAVSNRVTNYFNSGTYSIPPGAQAPYDPSQAPSAAQ